MVKKMLQAAALAGVVSLMPVAAAHAAQVCSTGSLVVCVDFTLGGSGTSYTLAVTYASSNGGGVLTDFGLDGNNAFGFTATGVTGSGSFLPTSNCSVQDDACAAATAPAPSNGLTVGQTATLAFTSAAGFNGDFSSTLLNAHIQSFANLPGCSVKIGTGSSQFSTPGTNGGSFNADVGTCSTTTTPEPASLFLFGSGLLGLSGGMVVRRRRRAGKE